MEHDATPSPRAANRQLGLRSFGEPGDRWSLARVYGAMLVAAVVGGLLGYLFDLLVGPLIGQHGWWTVTGSAGAIAGATAQAVREFARPRDPSVYAPTVSEEPTGDA
jgi:hypothetical protein